MSSHENLNSGNPGDDSEPTRADERDGNVFSPVQALATMAEAAEIWTVSEMENAIPCDILEIDEEPVDERAELEAAEKDHLMPAGEPEDDDEPAQDSETPADIETLGYSYPAPFTRWENFADYRIWPYRTVGKLFFKVGGQSFVCSASSIGGCAILTAGHCVHAGNNSPDGWATDVVFVPAYRDGDTPYGQWPARYLVTRTYWYQNGIPKGLSQDIGGAVLHRQNGRMISQRVGWLGFAWNWSRIQHWLSMGYPAASPFNGQRMQINAASYAYDGNVGANPKPVGMGNDLTGGSSGGPWVWQFGSNNYANGVNSYRIRTRPKEMFSPYFGNAAKSLYDTLRAGSC